MRCGVWSVRLNGNNGFGKWLLDDQQCVRSFASYDDAWVVAFAIGGWPWINMEVDNG